MTEAAGLMNAYDEDSDEVLSPYACPECRVMFGHATDCLDRED